MFCIKIRVVLVAVMEGEAEFNIVWLKNITKNAETNKISSSIFFIPEVRAMQDKIASAVA